MGRAWRYPEGGEQEGRALYTTAPEEYDYGTSSRGRIIGRIGNRPVQAVFIFEEGASQERLDYLAEYQSGRYQSGLYFSTDDHRVAEEFYGFEPAPSKVHRSASSGLCDCGHDHRPNAHCQGG